MDVVSANSSRFQVLHSHETADHIALFCLCNCCKIVYLVVIHFMEGIFHSLSYHFGMFLLYIINLFNSMNNSISSVKILRLLDCSC